MSEIDATITVKLNDLRRTLLGANSNPSGFPEPIGTEWDAYYRLRDFFHLVGMGKEWELVEQDIERYNSADSEKAKNLTHDIEMMKCKILDLREEYKDVQKQVADISFQEQKKYEV